MNMAYSRWDNDRCLVAWNCWNPCEIADDKAADNGSVDITG